ncbi:MAG: HAMP domain-containing histidine kinase [Methylococcaceae bacterium]|nr:HAMP domain-containing histidine kinase [Methylococcaceae bacterium]
MLTQVTPKSEISARQNLKWLFILRNMMIVGETLLIFLSINALNIRLPQQQLWMVVLSLGAFNVFTSMRMQTEEPVTDAEIFSQLAVDVLAIAALLYLTGGASNPITWVFLLPLMVTAIMLPQAYAWYMVILTTAIYTALIAFNIPLPSIEPHAPVPEVPHSDLEYYRMMQHAHVMSDKSYFSLHMFGMWFGFVFSAGLVAFFVANLARTLKFKERSLAVARENALRDERVIALGTLAASAAHDMGTPLGTIAIVAHELEQDYPIHRFPDLHEKTLIMQQQINRCKEALSVMSASAGEMRAESGSIMPMAEYIDNVITQWRTHKPGVKLRFFIDVDVAADAQIIAERTLTHSIINILNNAAEATTIEQGIEFHASWTLTHLIIKIRDFGPGLPPDFSEIVGKQPLTSKKGGLGVGLFLTCSTIHRIGGKIQFENMESGGACVEITLPLFNREEGNDDDDGSGD